MRRLLAGAGLVLVAAMTTSCGSAPDDASEKDFCKAMSSVPAADKPSQDDIDDWAEELEETGTPESISDDERDGFEIFVDLLGDIDADDSDEEIDEQIEDATDKDDEKKVEKFFAYAGETCADQG